jgi:hypothetical protein
MLTGIVKVVITMLLLFVAYQLILKHSGLVDTNPMVRERIERMEGFEVPVKAPIIVETPPSDGQRVIAPAGPNSPDMAAPIGERVYMDDPRAKDPYAEEQDDAHAPERMRHPERMFRPAPEMGGVSAAVGGGIASEMMGSTPNALQVFEPEFAQNGGYFMDGVMANDVDVPTNFSAF